MAEPFKIKAGDTLPAITATLTGADGNAVSLTGKTVEFRLRSAVYPFATILDGVEATPAPNQTTNRGDVSYAWQDGDTDTPGTYVAQWYVVEDDQTYPLTGFNYITIESSLGDDLPLLPLVTVGQIETTLGRELTDAEYAWVDQLITESTAVLETWLNRDLTVRTRTERHTIGSDRRLIPHHGPVQAVTSLIQDGYDVTEAYADAWVDWRPDAGAVVDVTYHSGDAVVNPAAVYVVRNAVVAAVTAGPRIAAGTMTSYSVEGTSITYGSAVTGDGGNGAAGRFSVASLNAVRRLRRPVVIW
jgi:hypothetical protein